MKRRFDFDVLRVAAMLGVIYLHTAAAALQDLNNIPLWWFSNVLTAVATPAVPLFFMMSGALLLRDARTADWRDVLCRRVPRLLVPLLAWSALVLAYNFLRVDRAQALDQLKNLLHEPAMVPYWFLYALIPIYLLSPMVKAMTDRLSHSGWNYMMGLWLVLTVGISTAYSFAPAEWKTVFIPHYTLNVNAVGGYLGYFLLGAYLERLEKRPPRRALGLGCAVMLAVSIFGTAWDTYAHGVYSDRFTNYLNIFTVVFSALIFLLAKDCLGEREERGRFLPWLANASFGIYLAHAPAIIAMQKLWVRLDAYVANIPQQLLFYAGVTAACIIGVALVSLIPGLSYLAAGLRWGKRKPAMSPAGEENRDGKP